MQTSSTETGFDHDEIPGAPRILFVGWPESSHTHSWIDLLEDRPFNRRLFALPSAAPPPDWPVKTYLTSDNVATPLNPRTRRRAYPPQPEDARAPRFPFSLAAKAPSRTAPATMEDCLADAILEWRPNVVHTLGLDAASYFYMRARKSRPEIASIGRWVVQARGGPDIALMQHSPTHRPLMEEVFGACDHFIADNDINYADAVRMGLAAHKATAPGLGVVSGPGGLDVDALRSTWTTPPSKRERIVLWPKAYETISSKALPVFEAIKIAWRRIQPVQFQFLWLVQDDVKIWFEKALPTEIRAHCRLFGRLDRDEVLKMLPHARVMLAPSLTDGIPNAMMEAMALGAFPIVSPLDTITPVVAAEKNVLFARNLYPDEIAAALIRALSDDALVDAAAEHNVICVTEMADRKKVKKKAEEYYANLSQLTAKTS